MVASTDVHVIFVHDAIKLPEVANLLWERNAKFIANGYDSILQSDAIDHIVRKILGVLKRKRIVTHHKLPQLLAPDIKNGPGAKIKLPLRYALRIGFRVKVA